MRAWLLLPPDATDWYVMLTVQLNNHMHMRPSFDHILIAAIMAVCSEQRGVKDENNLLPVCLSVIK